MNVFSLRDQLVSNYSGYIKSFISINDAGHPAEMELTLGEDENVKADDPAVKGMKEAARRFGLRINIEPSQ